MLEDKINHLTMAMAKTDNAMVPLEQAALDAKTQVDKNLTLLLRHLKVNSLSADEGTSTVIEVRITPSLYTLADLDAIERQYDDFLHALAVQQAGVESAQVWNEVQQFGSDMSFEAFSPSSEWSPSIVELRRNRHMREYQQHILCQLKKRQKKLSHNDQTPEEVSELAHIKSETLVLGH